MDIQYQCRAFEKLTLEQLYDLMALRQTVFVVEQHCPYLDADGNDQSAFHLLGYTYDQQLATYARILPVGTGYIEYAGIGRVVTAPFARGQGLGRRLMQTTVEMLYEHFGEGTPIKLSAQAHLQHYYTSLGFSTVGKAYLEDGIPHIAMIKI